MDSKDVSEASLGNEATCVPFETVQEAWFWFVAAQDAMNDGARVRAGSSTIPRPCEPVDILKILDRLYRQRRLLRDHLLVLRHYGRRHMAPDPRRPNELKACALWEEAIERLRPVLERKGIVCSDSFEAQPFLYANSTIFQDRAVL